MTQTDMPRGAFSGHETFPFRYTWLPKASRMVQENPEIFASDDAMVELGVGKNMVKSMRHWALMTGLIEEDSEVSNNRGRVLRPTELAKNLFLEGAWDPFLEDPATSWLLHWQLASAPGKATTWYWVFNHVPQQEFSKAQLLDWILALVEQNSWARLTSSSLKRDIDCFVRTYVPVTPTRTVPIEDTLDCPLVDLGLIREFQRKGNYLLTRSERLTLPDELFTFALLQFAERTGRSAQSLALDAIALEPGSPGRVFSLSEEALLSRLERLDSLTNGAVRFDETAGLRQVLFHDRVAPGQLLKAHYMAQTAAKGAA